MPDLLTTLPIGPVGMSHHITGTYFMCNDWHDGVNNHVQTWAEFPFPKDKTSHKWYLVTNPDGTVRIESFANRRCLTVGSKPSDVVTFQEQTDSLHQNWRFIHQDVSSDSYAIVSVVHPRFALGLAEYHQLNDKLLGLTRLWGGGVHMSQVWRVFPASEL
ncbi:RICIN domain-containing protein [Streptomyces sp. NPDC000410]|uniref:RICIN domain-containing protein n=1 Tax=Streptomyces sp. NPDC000410 TaxID=3154254 RepID=UPI00331C7781